MVYADDIIERSGPIILRNIGISSVSTLTDTWSSGLTGYGFLNFTYEKYLALDHLYYQRFTYKFTTTNQSPTWCRIYLQNGNVGNTDATVSNPVAGTEYTVSGVLTPIRGYTISGGTIYNGNSSAISGVTSYVKNVLTYDVTDLFFILRAMGVATTTAALKTWCDTNLEYRPSGVDYDVASIVNQTEENKVVLKQGTIIANQFIEPGGMWNTAANFNQQINAYFDRSDYLPCGVYNNAGGGTVVHTVIEDPTGPFYPEHKNVLRVVTNGTASPGAGGIWCSHMAAANKVFIERIVAKIPVGYNLVQAYNTQGTGATVSWITPQDGTGDWAEYAVLYRCGSSGSFSTGGHLYVNGSNNTSVTWYVAYARNCDITDHEELMYYSVLQNCDRFKSGNVYSTQFDTLGIHHFGAYDAPTNVILPSTWEFDYEDYAGNAKWSLVQPVNAGGRAFGPAIAINPNAQYKISYWVKCKQDMSHFLTPIYYYSSDGTLLNHARVTFKYGTRTQLTQELKAGDTSMKVKSNANWAAKNWSNVGFRSSIISYHNLGLAANGETGMISGVSGTDTVTFNVAYSGSTMPVNTYVVMGYDGSNYPYPIQKSMLPTDNTWKYVEGYFGRANVMWDGNDYSGAWYGVPFSAATFQVIPNMYSNNGTVPIKYSDIRVEAVEGTGISRNVNKISFSK